MIAKKSVFYSIFYEKCPRCHEGSLFVNKNPYSSMSFEKMHEKCPVCGQLTEPEIGFYQGAMFVSYPVSLIICLIVAIPLNFTVLTGEAIILILFFVLILLAPWIFRVSRMIWFNFFVHYQPEILHKRGINKHIDQIDA
jgi:uncharacterized protein (DUF983 family)